MLLALFATSALARPFDTVADPVLSLDEAFGRRRYYDWSRYARETELDADDEEQIELEEDLAAAPSDEVEDAVDQIEDSISAEVDEGDLKKNGVDVDNPDEVKAQLDKCVEVGEQLDAKKEQRRARAESTGLLVPHGGEMDEEKERWAALVGAGLKAVGSWFGRRRFSDEWLYRARMARFEEEELAIERKLEAEVEKCNEFNAAMEQNPDIEDKVTDATEEANEEEAGEVTEDEEAVAETVGKCTKLNEEIKEIKTKSRREVEEWAWARRARGEHISEARIEEEAGKTARFDWWGAIKNVAAEIVKRRRRSEWDTLPKEARDAECREEMIKLFAECDNLDSKMESNPETMEAVTEIAEDNKDELKDAADDMDDCLDEDGDGECDSDDEDDSEDFSDSNDGRSVQDWRRGARFLTSKLERLLQQEERRSRY